MKRVLSKDVKKFLGKKVKLFGYVHDVRLLGKINFLILRDREGKVQVTVSKDKVSPEIFDLVKKLHQEDVIAIFGKVVRGKAEGVEVEVIPERIDLVNKSHAPLPLDPRWVTQANLDTRLEWRPLDLRRRENLAIFKIQAKIIEAAEEFLRKKNFIQVFTPAIIGGISEGGAEVFKIDFFGKEAFLRQDPQLHRQLLILAGFEKIFDVGPNWRAEPSDTPYHLAEHRGIAPEFIVKDEKDVMELEEDLVINLIKKVVKECDEELKILGRNVKIPKKNFPELKFPEIYGILEEMGKKLPFGSDLDRESERILANYVKEKYKQDFFFINRFPFKVKPFYVMRVDEDPEWARSVDLIFKGVEQSSGGQREHRYEKIIEQIKEKRLNLENLKWFVEHFKYGAPPHGGFCLGLERFTMQLLDIQNIKEVVLFPRYTSRFLP
ncbi:MAG: aspartate--tRNA(Asn) ligase [Candidatus Aenigmatarchaeota archaeon]